MHRLGCRVLLLGLAVLTTACGETTDELSSVKGKVQSKGEPAAGVVVVFHPKDAQGLDAQRATAVTQADGSFQLATGARPGARPGSYVVTMTWPDEARKKKFTPIGTEPPPDPPDRLKGQYANQTRPHWTIEVKAGPNQLESFQLP